MSAITESPFLVTFAAGGLWQTVPRPDLESAQALAEIYSDENWPRGVVIWERRPDSNYF